MGGNMSSKYCSDRRKDPSLSSKATTPSEADDDEVTVDAVVEEEI